MMEKSSWRSSLTLSPPNSGGENTSLSSSSSTLSSCSSSSLSAFGSGIALSSSATTNSISHSKSVEEEGATSSSKNSNLSHSTKACSVKLVDISLTSNTTTTTATLKRESPSPPSSLHEAPFKKVKIPPPSPSSSHPSKVSISPLKEEEEDTSPPVSPEQQADLLSPVTITKLSPAESGKKIKRRPSPDEGSSPLRCSKCREVFSTKEAKRLHTCNSILDQHFLIESGDRLKSDNHHHHNYHHSKEDFSSSRSNSPPNMHPLHKKPTSESRVPSPSHVLPKLKLEAKREKWIPSGSPPLDNNSTSGGNSVVVSGGSKTLSSLPPERTTTPSLESGSSNSSQDHHNFTGKIRIKYGGPSPSEDNNSNPLPPSTSSSKLNAQDGYAYAFTGRPSYSPSRMESHGPAASATAGNVQDKESPRDASNGDSPASQADSGVFSIASSSSPSKGDVNSVGDGTSPDSPNNRERLNYSDQVFNRDLQWKPSSGASLGHHHHSSSSTTTTPSSSSFQDPLRSSGGAQSTSLPPPPSASNNTIPSSSSSPVTSSLASSVDQHHNVMTTSSSSPMMAMMMNNSGNNGNNSSSPNTQTSQLPPIMSNNENNPSSITQDQQRQQQQSGVAASSMNVNLPPMNPAQQQQQRNNCSMNAQPMQQQQQQNRALGPPPQQMQNRMNYPQMAPQQQQHPYNPYQMGMPNSNNNAANSQRQMQQMQQQGQQQQQQQGGQQQFSFTQNYFNFNAEPPAGRERGRPRKNPSKDPNAPKRSYSRKKKCVGADEVGPAAGGHVGPGGGGGIAAGNNSVYNFEEEDEEDFYKMKQGAGSIGNAAMSSRKKYSFGSSSDEDSANKAAAAAANNSMVGGHHPHHRLPGGGPMGYHHHHHQGMMPAHARNYMHQGYQMQQQQQQQMMNQQQQQHHQMQRMMQQQQMDNNMHRSMQQQHRNNMSVNNNNNSNNNTSYNNRPPSSGHGGNHPSSSTEEPMYSSEILKTGTGIGIKIKIKTKKNQESSSSDGGGAANAKKRKLDDTSSFNKGGGGGNNHHPPPHQHMIQQQSPAPVSSKPSTVTSSSLQQQQQQHVPPPSSTYTPSSSSHNHPMHRPMMPQHMQQQQSPKCSVSSPSPIQQQQQRFKSQMQQMQTNNNSTATRPGGPVSPAAGMRPQSSPYVSPHGSSPNFSGSSNSINQFNKMNGPPQNGLSNYYAQQQQHRMNSPFHEQQFYHHQGGYNNYNNNQGNHRFAGMQQQQQYYNQQFNPQQSSAFDYNSQGMFQQQNAGNNGGYGNNSNNMYMNSGGSNSSPMHHNATANMHMPMPGVGLPRVSPSVGGASVRSSVTPLVSPSPSDHSPASNHNPLTPASNYGPTTPQSCGGGALTPQHSQQNPSVPPAAPLASPMTPPVGPKTPQSVGFPHSNNPPPPSAGNTPLPQPSPLPPSESDLESPLAELKSPASCSSSYQQQPVRRPIKQKEEDIKPLSDTSNSITIEDSSPAPPAKTSSPPPIKTELPPPTQKSSNKQSVTAAKSPISPKHDVIKEEIKEEVEKSDFIPRWAELDEKILKKIFSYGIVNDGSCFMVRASRVCSSWFKAASDPSVWTHLDFSAGKLKEKYRSDKKLEIFLKKYPNVLELKCGNWRNAVGSSTLKIIAANCPKIVSLSFNGCFGLTNEDLKFIGDNFEYLERLDLSNVSPSSGSSRSAVSSTCLSEFITVLGKRLTYLNISNNKMAGLPFVFKALSSNSCNLRELDISNITTTSRDTILINMEKFQRGCPLLKALNCNHTMISLSDTPIKEQVHSPGFPLLERLQIAVDSRGYFDGMDDSQIERILKKSDKLRHLDIRGCQRVSDSCLIRLPTWDIENLILSGCSAASASPDGLELMVRKWADKLVEMDVSSTPGERAVNYAVEAFVEADTTKIKKLNLSCTAVSLKPLTRLLKNCPSLEYLNLSSCRGLARGMKRLYQTRPDIIKLRTEIIDGKFNDNEDSDD